MERQLKELQEVHKKAEYQSIKKIGESQVIPGALCSFNASLTIYLDTIDHQVS